MRKKSTDKQNSTAGINPIASWRLSNVKALSDYKLEVVFNDGTHGIVDMHDFVMNSDAGVFIALQDISLFNQVYLAHGVVTWPGEIDLAPDRMYQEIKKRGKWVL